MMVDEIEMGFKQKKAPVWGSPGGNLRKIFGATPNLI
jgi:hypothetical protein